MNKTLFAGLTILDPGEPIDSDSGAFIGVDRKTIDHLLEIGAKTHRHTGLSGLSNPLTPASAGVIASGGTLAADLGISIGYTLQDSNQGETMLSPVATVSTRSPMEAPSAAPSGVFDKTAGSLMVNTYYYATTFSDGEGGETQLGPAVTVERQPGFASGRVNLSALSFGMAAAGAAGWRLYRAIGGGQYSLLATGTADTFTDDGSTSPDCGTHPPAGEENTTKGISSLLVVLPSGVQAGTEFINLYASVTGDFGGGSLLEQFPVASAGRSVAFLTLALGTTSPPSVNLSIGGAHQIDPDTEILEWHWKRPVSASAVLPSGSQGDVRLALGDGGLYAVLGSAAAVPKNWTRIGSGATVSGSTLLASGAGSVPSVEQLTFLGSGGVLVKVTEEAAHKALVTVTAGAPRLQMVASGLTVPELESIEISASGGMTVKHTNPGPHQSKLAFEGDRATLGQEGMGVIVHQSNENVARGTKFKQYTWIGKVKPKNMQEYDIWIEA